MEITDEEKAQHYLSHIGYYRLSAYMYPLLSIPKEQHLFKRGVSFGKVMMLYHYILIILKQEQLYLQL